MMVERNREIRLPLDMVHLILQSLPVKSLMRFKIVCKSWNTIISSYEFAKSHLQVKLMKNSSEIASDSDIFLWRPRVTDRDYRLVTFDDGKFRVEAKHELDKAITHLCFGDCLALSPTYIYQASYLLWNPRTRQQAIISSPPYNEFIHTRETAFGFCRVPTLEDYKIVVVFCGYYVVYSCKSKSWSEKKVFPFSADTNIFYQKEGLFFGGFSFWVTHGIDSKHEILYFDPRYEAFNKLEIPEKLHIRRMGLVSLDGYLCFYNESREHLRIWKLQDNNLDDYSSINSWSEFMTVGLNRGVYDIIKPLFVVNSDKLVIEWWQSAEKSVFYVYDSMKNKLEQLDADASLSSSRNLIPIAVPILDTLYFPA